MNIDEHYDKVFRFCYWKVHNKEIAEDITQETFLRYFKSNYQEKGKELNYLYTIARNLCIDEYSKLKIEFTIDGELSDDGSSIAEMEKEVLVKLALDQLSDKERELVVLRYMNEEPIKNISRLLGISRFAVSRKLKAIEKKLWILMKDGELDV